LWHEGNSQQYLYEYLIEYLELKWMKCFDFW
jgi:hypothetical protein